MRVFWFEVFSSLAMHMRNDDFTQFEFRLPGTARPAEMLQTRGCAGAGAVLGLQQLHSHTRCGETTPATPRR